jgi:hypothetical protein
MRAESTLLALGLGLLVAAVPLAAKEPGGGKATALATRWPSRAAGRYSWKTFRFRPASFQYRNLMTVGGKIAVYIGIRDPAVPADYFHVISDDVPSVPKRLAAGRSATPGLTERGVAHRLRALQDYDGGYLTVRAYDVGVPHPKWPDPRGRLLMGHLVVPKKSGADKGLTASRAGDSMRRSVQGASGPRKG